MLSKATPEAEDTLLYPLPLDDGPVSAVRGTLLALDQRWLRDQGHYTAYVDLLGAQRAIWQSLAMEWVPFPVAMAHWRTIDTLGVSTSAAFEAGRFVGAQIHGGVLRTLVQLAGSVGFTPWMALSNCHKFWRRSWRGGAVVVHRRGASSARVEVIRASVVRARFFRAALLGTIAVGLEPFCKRVVVSEHEPARTDDAMSIRIAWQ